MGALPGPVQGPVLLDNYPAVGPSWGVLGRNSPGVPAVFNDNLVVAFSLLAAEAAIVTTGCANTHLRQAVSRDRAEPGLR